MKHFFTAIILAISAIIFSVSAYAFQNEPDGFRGIKWGQNLSANKAEMTLIEGNNIYARKNDQMSIGAAKLNGIYYRYYKGRLQMVLISCQGLVNKNDLMKAFRVRFGPPGKPNQYIEKYYWRGATTFISFSYNEITGKTTVGLVSMKLNAQEKKDKAKAAAKAGSDF